MPKSCYRDRDCLCREAYCIAWDAERGDCVFVLAARVRAEAGQLSVLSPTLEGKTEVVTFPASSSFGELVDPGPPVEVRWEAGAYVRREQLEVARKWSRRWKWLATNLRKGKRFLERQIADGYYGHPPQHYTLHEHAKMWRGQVERSEGRAERAEGRVAELEECITEMEEGIVVAQRYARRWREKFDRSKQWSRLWKKAAKKQRGISESQRRVRKEATKNLIRGYHRWRDEKRDLSSRIWELENEVQRLTESLNRQASEDACAGCGKYSD